MKHPKKFFDIYAVIHDICHNAKQKIADYENNIEGDYELKKRFYNIDFVYMHSIILDIAKLTSATSSDKTGLKDLRKICKNPDIIKRIDELEKKHSNAIIKVKANRSKIIAHVDVGEHKPYYEMKFSESAVKGMTGDTIKFKGLISASPEMERYSPSDFLLDLPSFKDLINDILLIVKDINLYFYDKK